MPHKLLLADDSVTIQRVIELTFADEDVQVLAVGDGQQAIASIQSERPDIVLADVGMPERDGYEVAEFVKGNPQLASIPVLLLTGAFEPIDEQRARESGCDGVLVKPFEPQMVINRVKDLLAGRRSGGLWGNKTAPTPPSREAPPAAKEAEDQPVQAAAASASLEEYFDRLDAAFASVGAAIEAPDGSEAHHANAAEADAGPGLSGLAKHDLEGWDPDLSGDARRLAATPPPLTAPPVTAPPVTPPGPAAAAPPVLPPIPFKSVTPADVPGPAAAETVMTSPAPAPAVSIPPATAPSPVPAEPPPVVAEAAPMPVVEHRAPVPQLPAPPPASVVATTPTPPVAVSQTMLPSLAEAFATLLSAEQGRSISPPTVRAADVSDTLIDEIVNRVIARMTDQSVRDTVMDVAERLVREEIDRIKQGARG